MARKNSGALDDLMEITARLPWQVGLVLAVAAFFIFHHYATQAPLPTNPAELKAMGKTMAESVASGVLPAVASVL